MSEGVVTVERLGIGVVGVGGMARAFHLPAVERTGRARVTAVCDVNAEALRAARAVGAETYTRYEDLVASPRVDAVIVAASNDLHAPVALAALRAGKPVLCEKPLALSAAQAREMHEEGTRRGLVTGVNFSYRNDPGVRFIKDLLQRGEIGPPTFLMLQYLQGYLTDPQMPLTWRRQSSSAGTGILGDLGSHLIDLCRYWIGEITTVTAHTRIFVTERPDGQGGTGRVDVDDAVSFACDFATGTMGVISSTGYATGHGNDQRAEIYGPDGALIYENTDQQSIGALFGQTAARHGLFGRLAVPARYHETESDQVAAFVTAILDGRPMTPSFLDGLRCQEVVDAVAESAREGRRVPISASPSAAV
jgi:predicted dehydrogenase